MKRIHNNLKNFPITKTSWFHRTTEEGWLKIQKEGLLWGGDTYHKTLGKEGYRYTYLSSYDWGNSYGPVLLEVYYRVTGLDGIDTCRFIDDNKHNNIVSQFSVFVPINVENCKRVCSYERG